MNWYCMCAGSSLWSVLWTLRRSLIIIVAVDIYWNWTCRRLQDATCAWFSTSMWKEQKIGVLAKNKSLWTQNLNYAIHIASTGTRLLLSTSSSQVPHSYRDRFSEVYLRCFLTTPGEKWLLSGLCETSSQGTVCVCVCVYVCSEEPGPLGAAVYFRHGGDVPLHWRSELQRHHYGLWKHWYEHRTSTTELVFTQVHLQVYKYTLHEFHDHMAHCHLVLL